MPTTTPHRTNPRPEPAAPRPSAPRRADSIPTEHPSFGQIFDERAPIIGAPAFFGPPIITVLGPWLLLVLLLIGPFALILVALLALTLGAILLGVVAMVLASPYLLIHHLHARGAHPLTALLHPIQRHRVSSARLRSLQVKGMS